MSLMDSPAFNTYEPVPTSRLNRQEAVELHVPPGERLKPEMLRFIEGQDDRSRPHLMATAQALARAELRAHDAYKNRMRLAERMYKVWSFLALWSTYGSRQIGWDRPRKEKGKRKITHWRVWASDGESTVASATGHDPYDAAEKLAERLKLL